MDPVNWNEYRNISHEIIDLVVDNLQNIRNERVWTQMPDNVREKHLENLNSNGEKLEIIIEEFKNYILPYGSGNIHPGFMGWVQGGGNTSALIGDILASFMNMNCGGRDHVGILLETQIIHWVKQWFNFPPEANGVFVTGSSMANFMSVITARKYYNNKNKQNLQNYSNIKYVVYTSVAAHRCIRQAVFMSGLENDSELNEKEIQQQYLSDNGGIRLIPIDSNYCMDLVNLEERIRLDINIGLTPLMIVATAGTVDVGSIDNLTEISRICKQYDLWMHVDGAFGALGILSNYVKPLLQGIQLADSIAFDFHKWAQVQYDAGMIIVRNGDNLRNTFSSSASYLSRETSGMLAGNYWPCDYGPDLSRSCRALKTWFTLKTYGTEGVGQIITRSCELAQELQNLIMNNQPLIELLAPVTLNIVCFRFCGDLDSNLTENQLNQLNRTIVIQLHLEGRIAPSLTTINKKIAIRAALFNHRTLPHDIQCLIESTIRLGKEFIKTLE